MEVILANNFIVLGDFFDISLNNKEIIPNYVLKKADIDYLNKINESFNNFKINDLFRLYHEWNIVIKDEKIKQQTKKDIKDWEYWIIECSDNEFDYDLYFTLLLVDDICWAIEIIPRIKDTKATYYQQRFINYQSKKYLSIIDTVKLENIKKYYLQFKNIEKDLESDEFVFILKAMRDYVKIFDFPDSELKILSLFTIIELLLTHNSKVGNENSISHQFVNKIILINNYIKEPIDFLLIFNKNNDKTYKNETILKKLYDYRNCLAHGNIVDFDDKLKDLISHEKIFYFVNIMIKKLLIFSLFYKELIRDLKKC